MIVTVRDKSEQPIVWAARYGHYNTLLHCCLNFTAVMKLSEQFLYLRWSWNFKVPYYT